MSIQTSAAAGGAPVDLVDDDLFAVPDRPRIGRLTTLLVMGLLACAGFTGGVMVQKHHDAAVLTTAPAAAARNRFGTGGFTGANGFQGFGQSGAGPGGTGASGNGAGGSGSAGSGSGSGGAGPVVVGQIVAVSGNTLTVRNFAGKVVKVTVPDGATVSTVTQLSALRPGTAVSVEGSTSASGAVTASAVTARKG